MKYWDSSGIVPLRVHALRTADALQLSAALIASDHDPSRLEDVSHCLRRASTAVDVFFYDDVMQAVFSFFFSFLLLPSLEVLWTILLSVPLARRLCPHTL